MNLFPDQERALQMVAKEPASLLTGSAGTGKSTVVKSILEKLRKPGFRYALAAPSGKAARRLSEVTGQSASTIHRLLEPQKIGDRFVFTKGPNDPLEIDLLVIDEVSMVDIGLMASLLQAVARWTKLLLVGDPYQLSSVGPGNVLHDILASGAFPVTELDVIKRQNPGLLLKNCHRIKDGLDILVDNDPSCDFFFFSRQEEADIQKKVIDLVANSLPASKGYDRLRDIQVISPFRERTGLSCKVLNEKLQNVLNPNAAIEGCRFRPGDKIIQTKNNYELPALNGDMGFIKDIDKPGKKITVQFENPDRVITVPLHENDLELAYALTIHKSQGSEWPAVVIPMHRSFRSPLVTRNLLYTAVSRARDLCIMVGHREEIPSIVRKSEIGRRMTHLRQLLHDQENIASHSR